MGRLFGTDGVRGLANKDITAELALQLGISAARVLTANSQNGQNRRPRAVVGRDPRISGEFLAAAISAGFASAGLDVVRAGVLPTPALAYLTSRPEYDLGVMISASHNPMQDNGIKFFAQGGYKLADTLEDKIESLLGQEWDRPTHAKVGDISRDERGADRQYLQHLAQAVPTSLKGMRIVVDCANGAASNTGPEALRQAGADVVVINAYPDGRNINDHCGSTHPERLQALTVAAEADLGVAFDGDADRCLAVDADGKLVDGDQIMGILALGMKERGELAGDTLVVTVMSNLGLILAMKEAGIKTVQTGVGDRYVLEAMRESGYNLGGEQSGHVINTHHATTGDGLLTALMLAAQMQESGKSLAELAKFMTRLPQVLINVPGVDKTRASTDEVLAAKIAQAEAELAGQGRVLLRSSGTEPLVRVMVEAPTTEQAEAVAGRLADVVKSQLAL